VRNKTARVNVIGVVYTVCGCDERQRDRTDYTSMQLTCWYIEGESHRIAAWATTPQPTNRSSPLLSITDVNYLAVKP